MGNKCGVGGGKCGDEKRGWGWRMLNLGLVGVNFYKD